MMRRSALVAVAAACAAGCPARVSLAAGSRPGSRAEISVRLRGSPSAPFDAAWKTEERLRVRTCGLHLSLVTERDPGERRWADHWSATLATDGHARRPQVFVGDLALRAPGLAFSARGADARPVRLSPPAPPRVSAWESAAEFGSVRGAGVLASGRRWTVAAAAGWTPLDSKRDEDGGLPLFARSGDHTPGSRVRADAAVERSLFISTWLGKWPRGVGVTVFAAGYRPAFAPEACGPRGTVRGDVTTGWRIGDTAAWASAGADARGRDVAAGWRRAVGRATVATAFAYSDGDCPCGARRPRPAAGRTGGVEALQSISWTAPALSARVEWEARASGDGAQYRALRAEVRHGAETADGVVWAASVRPSSRRASVIWRRPLIPGVRALVSAARGTSGSGSNGRLGMGVEGSTGILRWGVSVHAAAEGPSPGGGGALVALPKDGAVSGAFLAIKTESWGITARTARAWRPDGRAATGIALGFTRSHGWDGSRDL